MQNCTTKNLLEEAQQEFSVKGFEGTSLADILNHAGLKEADFEDGCPEKAALFDALVSDAAEGLMRIFRSAQNAHFDLIPSGQKADNQEVAAQNMEKFVNFIYDHLDAFRLILTKSEGTPYADYIQEIVNLDVARTEEFYAELRRTGRSNVKISYQLHRVISRAYFTGVFDTVICNMPRDEALRNVTELSAFFRYGWMGFTAQQK